MSAESLGSAAPLRTRASATSACASRSAIAAATGLVPRRSAATEKKLAFTCWRSA